MKWLKGQTWDFDMYTFSYNLRYYRKKKGITVGEMARRLHVNRNVIWRWENNIRYPNLCDLYEIARALEIDVTKLVERNENALLADDLWGDGTNNPAE